MISLLLLLVFLLGGTWLMLLQGDIIRRHYRLNKQRQQQHLANTPRTFKVVARQDMSAQHFSVRLQAIDKRPLEKFQAGQYLTLLTKTQAGQEQVSRRCYSLARWQNTPDVYELGIQREQRGEVSNWLHQHLQLDATIQALPPKGHFVFDLKNTEHAVLIAGGIGITPLRAMIHQFVAQQYSGRSKVKSLHLFYTAKSVTNMCYLDEFSALAFTCPNFYFFPLVSQTSHTPNPPNPQGRLSAPKIIQHIKQGGHDFATQSDCQYYLCGPNAMMDDITADLIQQGVTRDGIHFERFGAGAVTISDAQYSVKVGTKHELVFHQQPNLLVALEHQGINIQSECRSGECGQCKITLHSGEINQQIEPEAPLAAGEYLACCCVPASDLHIAV